MSQDRIICNKSDLTAVADTIRSKLGVTDTYYVSELSDAIERIPTGTQLPTLTNPGTSSDLLSGKELIDQNGNKVIGTIQTKSSQIITPGTTDQTINSGVYLTGAQTIKGDANLIASNIKSGVSIFGVTGTASGGGSGGSKLTQVVDGTVTELTAEDLQGLTKIGNFAFYNCSTLRSMTIPNGVTYIGTDSFYGCSALESILIPSSVTTIDNTAFSQTGLLSIEIPDSVTSLGGTVFTACKKLKNAIIGNGVKELGVALFQNSTSLKKVIIGQAVTKIGSSAFNNCSALVDIRIPANVTNLGTNALKIGSTTNKAVIRMEPRTPPTITTKTFDTTKLDSILVHSGCLDAYKSATNWANFASYIKEGLG